MLSGPVEGRNPNKTWNHSKHCKSYLWRSSSFSQEMQTFTTLLAVRVGSMASTKQQATVVQETLPNPFVFFGSRFGPSVNPGRDRLLRPGPWPGRDRMAPGFGPESCHVWCGTMPFPLRTGTLNSTKPWKVSEKCRITLYDHSRANWPWHHLLIGGFSYLQIALNLHLQPVPDMSPKQLIKPFPELKPPPLHARSRHMPTPSQGLPCDEQRLIFAGRSLTNTERLVRAAVGVI